MTDEQMWSLWNAQGSDAMDQKEAIEFARAIESATDAPLLERSAKMQERIDGLVQEVAKGADEEAEQRQHIAEHEQDLGMAKTEIETLREIVKHQSQQLEAARKDAERYRFIRDANRSSCIDHELATYAMESLDEYVDAAMEDEKRNATDAAISKEQAK